MSTRAWRGPSSRGTATVVAVAGLALTFLAAYTVHTSAEVRRQSELIDRSEAAEDVVAGELHDIVTSARAVAAVVSADPAIGPEAYANAVDSIVDRRSLGVVTGLNLVEYVPEGTFAEFEADVRSTDPAFSVHPQEPEGSAGIITYVHPQAVNAAASGFDTFTNPAARAALEAARVTGLATMTDGLRLVQETGEQTGVVIYVPIERLDDGEFHGWVSTVIRGQQFLSGLDFEGLDLAIRVVDESGEGPRMIGAVPAATPFEDAAMQRTLNLYGQTWTLDVVETGGLLNRAFWTLETVTLLAGLAITALTTLLVIQIGRREEHAQQMVEKATVELRAANEELTAADRVKDDFLAVVSHEFRTPLTVIRGSAEMLTDEGVPPEMQAELLGRITSNANRLTAMVGDLLVAARLDGGKLRAFPQVVPLAATVDMVIEELGELAAGVENHVDTEAVLVADRFHFERIVSNLLSNAHKYGEAPVVVSGRADGAVFEVSVRDHGAGVSPDMEQRLFGAFEEGSSVSGRRPVGVGLGLNIVKRLAQLNGGDVVYRRAAPGAEFVIRLPSQPPAVLAVDQEPVASRA